MTDSGNDTPKRCDYKVNRALEPCDRTATVTINDRPFCQTHAMLIGFLALQDTTA